MKSEDKNRLFKVALEGTPSNQDGKQDPAGNNVDLTKLEKDIVSAVETKLEEKTNSMKDGLKSDLKDGLKTELETMITEKIDQAKKEMVELSKSNKQSADDATEIEKIQLQKLNSCVKDGAEKVTLQQYREYMDKLNLQVRTALRGGKIELDATIAGFAGFDDARGGALIIPEVDKTIRQDFVDYDEGLMNSITFEPAMSRTKRCVVDVVEPDENTQATKETLEKIGYTLDDGCFVSATLNLKDYDSPARITYDQIEDEAFRIEPYINGKLVQGSRRKVAKDLWIGNSADKIKGIINYPQGNKYGQVAVKHVATSGKITMTDIMNLCIANKNKGVLFIDRATWGTLITEKDENGRYLFELGSVAQGAGTQPFHVDAVVPLLNVPVVFDDAFILPEMVAANIKAAILPPSAIAGYKRPVARFMVKDHLKNRDMLLTERYDAVLTQFKYVKLLSGVAE
jgi:HK97 family phage major capsid protein|nr:MAG TPA: major capsid protein [Caudoviricetes sp.]